MKNSKNVYDYAEYVGGEIISEYLIKQKIVSNNALGIQLVMLNSGKYLIVGNKKQVFKGDLGTLSNFYTVYSTFNQTNEQCENIIRATTNPYRTNLIVTFFANSCYQKYKTYIYKIVNCKSGISKALQSLPEEIKNDTDFYRRIQQRLIEQIQYNNALEGKPMQTNNTTKKGPRK